MELMLTAVSRELLALEVLTVGIDVKGCKYGSYPCCQMELMLKVGQ